MKFTIIHSKGSHSKYPVSTLDDPKVFKFENIEVYGAREVAGLFSRHYILNYPLKQDLTSPRKANMLDPYIVDSVNHMILDFNDVPDKISRDQILLGFKNFRHVAFKTKTCDDIFNFNFRLVLWIPDSTRLKLLKDTRKLAKWLDPRLGWINNSLYKKAQVTAQGSNGIISWNDNGSLFLIEEFKEAMCWDFTGDLKPTVMSLFVELGFTINQDYGDQVILSDENLGDFTWFSSNPFTLVSVIDSTKIDITKEFKARYKINEFRTAVSIKQLLDHYTSNRKINNHLIESNSLATGSLNEHIIRTIQESGCMVLKSPMGTGKTRIIRDFMNRSSSCLIITPRVSLADEFYERFKEDGVKIYNKHRLEHDTKMYICQFDSLYKINLRDNQFDTIIIDEFMTLGEHIVSSIANNKEHNISKLLALMKHANSLMLSDAFIEKNALDLLPAKFKNIEYITNQVKDDCSITMHKTLDSFLQSLIANRAGGLIVSCVSVAAGYAIKSFLEASKIKVGLINANTSQEARAQLIKSYKYQDIQALVYSPSVSVGVNIMGLEGKHFHYDPGNVIPVIQSIQMVRRSRTSKNIQVFIRRNKRDFIPSLEEERFRVLNGEDTFAGVEFNEHGDRKLSDVGRFLAILRYQRKLWMIDSNKTFARLAGLNFSSVNSTQATTRANLSLRNFRNVDEYSMYQQLDIFGTKSSYVQDRLEYDEIMDFILFEKYYRITYKLPGFDIARDDLVQTSDFRLDAKLELFKECIEGVSNEEMRDKKVRGIIIPCSFSEKRGLFWGSKWVLNRRYVEICRYLHPLHPLQPEENTGF